MTNYCHQHKPNRYNGLRIQSLLEPCDRATYGERLRAGAKKLDISVRSLQRLFKKYQEHRWGFGGRVYPLRQVVKSLCGVR